MNQLVAGVVVTYGTAYMVRYAVNCFTNVLINKTTDVIKSRASRAWNYIRNKKPKKEPIEYELVDIDGYARDDQITYVTSKRQVSENWRVVGDYDSDSESIGTKTVYDVLGDD